MKLLSTKIGRRTSDPKPVPPDKLAQHRIAAARACRAWEEIDVDRLVRRERGFLVDAETDEVFTPYRGDAFSPGGVILANMTPLVFFVVDDVHVLERHPRKWSEIMYERERSAAR